MHRFAEQRIDESATRVPPFLIVLTRLITSPLNVGDDDFFFLSLSLGKGFTGSRFLRDPMISQGDRHPDDSWDTREPRGLTSRRGMKHVGLSQHLFSRMFLGEGEILGVDKADRCRPRRSSTAYTTLIDYQDIRRKGKFGSALSLHPTLINHSLSLLPCLSTTVRNPPARFPRVSPPRDFSLRVSSRSNRENERKLYKLWEALFTPLSFYPGRKAHANRFSSTHFFLFFFSPSSCLAHHHHHHHPLHPLLVTCFPAKRRNNKDGSKCRRNEQLSTLSRNGR